MPPGCVDDDRFPALGSHRVRRRTNRLDVFFDADELVILAGVGDFGRSVDRGFEDAPGRNFTTR